jgi:hypothetical protein
MKKSELKTRVLVKKLKFERKKGRKENEECIAVSFLAREAQFCSLLS